MDEMEKQEAIVWTKEDLLKAVETAQGKKVFVVGDAMLDVYEYCVSKDSRILDEHLGTISYVNPIVVKRLGGAANVAANLSALGVFPVFLGVVGKDSAGDDLMRLFREQVKGESYFFTAAYARTTVKSRLFIDGEYVLRRDFESKMTSTLARLEVFWEFRRRVADADIVVLSDYNRGAFRVDTYCGFGDPKEFVTLSRKYNKPVVADPKPENIQTFCGATIITPNEKEFVKICNLVKTAGIDVAKKLGSSVAVTRGSKSTILYGDNALTFHKVNPVRNADIIGAGDTFTAGVALGLCAGVCLEACVALGNLAAGVAVVKPGTATVRVEELREAIKKM